MLNSREPNRLVHEKSPYLLQHAYNPVDWYPWGDEAFDRARQEDKPVFLSIGYSTCHWCHVMERESFEDIEVAEVINAGFIPIKVDREERPDIDAVYMQVCQMLTGQGGWPMTVFLAPDKKAFYAGTYFPKKSRYGRPGLLDILTSVLKLWKTEKEKLTEQGDEILDRLAGRQKGYQEQVAKSDCHEAFETFRRSFDVRYGGFGHAPKFPTPHNMMFLLRYYHLEHQKQALEMVETTLQSMYRGGMFDHIGFGFSRYSTDEKWLIPHFEKMLYDNALLTSLYLETYQITGNSLYRSVAEKTLEYISREMTSPEGGFFSAQDADVEGEEGLYYVLTPETIRIVLGDSDGEAFCRWFGITDKGNFENASIPNLLNNELYQEADERIASLMPKIYEYRLSRASLFKDDKILTSWNALMVTAFAKAFQILQEDTYLAAASKAAGFIRDKLTDTDGRLYVRYRDGEAAGTGYLEDYAYTAWAMLSMYEATYDVSYLSFALAYAETMCRLFEDSEEGGFFLYGESSETLMLRPKETYDGAMPSGNAVAAYVLIKLAQLTADTRWESRASAQLSFLASDIKDYPASHCFGLMAAMQELYPTREIVCTVSSDDEARRLRKALAVVFCPDSSILVKTKDNQELLNDIAPFTGAYLVMDNKTNFYICENKACSVPFTGVDELVKKLKREHNTAAT